MLDLYYLRKVGGEKSSRYWICIILERWAEKNIRDAGFFSLRYDIWRCIIGTNAISIDSFQTPL